MAYVAVREKVRELRRFIGDELKVEGLDLQTYHRLRCLSNGLAPHEQNLTDIIDSFATSEGTP